MQFRNVQVIPLLSSSSKEWLSVLRDDVKLSHVAFFVSSLNYAYVTTVHCIDPTTSTLKQNSLNLHFANN